MPCEISYSLILEGLSKRERLIMKGTIIEPPCHTFIPPDVVNELDADARKLYQRVEKMGDKALGWKSRLDFINAMKDENSIAQSCFKGHFFVSFDDELLDIFFKHSEPNDITKVIIGETMDLFHQILHELRERT